MVRNRGILLVYLGYFLIDETLQRITDFAQRLVELHTHRSRFAGFCRLVGLPSVGQLPSDGVAVVQFRTVLVSGLD